MLLKIRNSLFILALIISCAFSFQLFFDTTIEYQMMGLNISTSVRADFNNDGYIDFILGSNSLYQDQYYNILKYYTNNGDGTFQSPVDVPAGVNHSVMLTGDFNNDGWKDFVALGNYPYNYDFHIYIFMNDGTGNLLMERVYSKISIPYITVMDINNDGFDDILQLGMTGLNVMFSNGDGTFTFGTGGEEMVTIPLEALGNIRPWEVNADEYPDLMVRGTKTVTPPVGSPYSQSFIATYINNGDTTFTFAAEYLYGTTPGELIQSASPGYFNSDVYIDLLIKDNENTFIILTGNENGSFSFHDSPGFSTPFPTTHGDINGDGLSDILISDSENSNIYIRLNKGEDEISFANPLEYSGKWNLESSYPKIGTEDFNNDGYDDIYLSHYSFTTILNHGDGTFPVLQKIPDMGFEAYDILAEDFNRDGFPDLMTIDENQLYLSYNDGKGQFPEQQTISSGLDWHHGIFSGDFNADEIPDFAVTKGLKLFYGLEEGGFQSGPSYGDSIPGLTGMDGTSAHLNNDSFIDFILYWFGSIRVILSDESGSYRMESYVFSSDGVSQIKDIEIVDIDQDSDMDILFGFMNGVYINYNDGEGGFLTVDSLTSGGSASYLVAEDFNDDGYIDIAATHTETFNSYVFVYFNNGNGTFTAPQTLDKLWYPNYTKISAADMDNDDDMDLVTTVSGSNQIAIFLNEGEESFADVQYYTAGDNPVDFVLADFNKDTTMDVAITSSVPGYDYVYLFMNEKRQETTSINKNTRLDFIPDGFSLSQNYPNPFNPVTTIQYSVGGFIHGGDAMHGVSTPPLQIDLSIYNTLGQKITTLVSEKQNPGKYSVQWNAAGFASGVYYYNLSNNQGFSQTKKLILLR